MATFKPSHPAIFPTADNVFEGAFATHSEFIVTVPAFIEVSAWYRGVCIASLIVCGQKWAGDSDKVEALRSLKGLVSGGGRDVRSERH